MSANAPRDMPGSCDPDQLIQSWCDAVDAYHRRDADAVAAALFPELSDQETYARTVTFTVLAAALCGERVRKDLPPPPSGFYTLSARNQCTGNALNPDDSIEAANMLTVGRLLAAAANQDFDLVNDIALAHMPPGSDPDRALGVLECLLGIYCEAGQGEASDTEEAQR